MKMSCVFGGCQCLSAIVRDAIVREVQCMQLVKVVCIKQSIQPIILDGCAGEVERGQVFKPSGLRERDGAVSVKRVRAEVDSVEGQRGIMFAEYFQASRRDVTACDIQVFQCWKPVTAHDRGESLVTDSIAVEGQRAEVFKVGQLCDHVRALSIKAVGVQLQSM